MHTGTRTMVSHHIAASMHALPLRHHASEAACIWKHFSTGHTRAACEILSIYNTTFLFVACSRMVEVITALGCRITWLILSFDIYRRLRSNSVFWWSWARLLWVSPMLLVIINHLSSHSMSTRVAIGYAATHQVIVLLDKAERVRWGAIVMKTIFVVCGETLCIWACGSLLSCSWSESIGSVSLIWSNTACTSFISLLGAMASPSGDLPSSNHLSRLRLHATMVLIHFIFEGSGSNWPSSFKNAKLLIQDLWVCKALIACRLTKVRWAHHLLRHHEIVCLRPINTFLALNRAYTVGWWLDASASNCSNGSNTTNSSWHPVVTLRKLFYCPRPIRVLSGNFGAIAL